MNSVLIPLPDGRWLALTNEELCTALRRAEGMGFPPNAAPAAPLVAGDEPLCDSRAMGERLGVSAEWCEAAAARGEIPSVRVGRYLRFDPAQVMTVITNRRHADSRA